MTRYLLPFLLVAAPALAQNAVVLPTRDVTMVVRLAGAADTAIPGGAPGTLRLQWQAGAQRLRVEPEGRRQVLVLDLSERSVAFIDSGAKTAMSLPMRERDLQPLKLAGAKLSPKGHETIAGLACTDYDVQASRGHGTVCLTPDGVALRAAGEVDGHEGSFTAISVQYGAVPASTFEVPQDYMQLDLQKMLRPPK